MYEPTNSPSLLIIPDSQNSSSSSSPLCSPQNVRFSPNITHTPYHTNQSIPYFNSSQPRQTSPFVNSSTANFSPIHIQQTPPLRPNYQAPIYNSITSSESQNGDEPNKPPKKKQTNSVMENLRKNL